jgi:hypothetical protein
MDRTAAPAGRARRRERAERRTGRRDVFIEASLLRGLALGSTTDSMVLPGSDGERGISR